MLFPKSGFFKSKRRESEQGILNLLQESAGKNITPAALQDTDGSASHPEFRWWTLSLPQWIAKNKRHWFTGISTSKTFQQRY
jgi:hypothetical protein